MNTVKQISLHIQKIQQLIDNDLNQTNKKSDDKVDVKSEQWHDTSIVLEIGHGPHPDGFEPGAVDPRTKVREWDLNKVVANVCYDHLKKLGYTDVLITDANDYLFSIGAKHARADIFVSIHHNAFSNPKAQGTETLVHPECTQADQKLAKVINQQICDYLGTHDRGVKERKLGVLTRDTHERHADGKGVVLIEPYFITGHDVDDHTTWSTKSGEALATAIDLVCSDKARV